MKENKKKERVLTPKEKIRSEKIDILSKKIIGEGYEKKELTISIVYANVMAFVLCLPICIIFAIPYFYRNLSRILGFSIKIYLVWLLSIIVSIVLHELIHGMFWGAFAKKHFQSIEFGFIKEYATPYCTCLEPLTKIQYIIGTAMPGVILGIVPMALSIWTGSFALYLYGFVMTSSAGGDFTIIMKLFQYKTVDKEVIFLDHPTECGLICFEKSGNGMEV